jgi:RNA polymerase sigma-32 factor
MDYINSLSHQADLAFVRKAMKRPILERDVELDLTKAWYEHKDEKALHELIESYGRLVISLATKYKSYGLSLSDLIQEGNLGLLQAANRFDPERGVRFSTYAKWWIRAHIQDFVLRNWSIVRTGSTTVQKNLFFNLNRLRSKLISISTEMMSPEDQKMIAEHLDVSIHEVENMEARLAGHDLSLSNPISEHADNNWQDLIFDTRLNPEENSFQEHAEQNRHNWIEEALLCLSERERFVIKHRRLSDPPQTLEILGKELSITKERVRQIEAKAIRRMRYYFMESMHEVHQAL